MGRFSRDRYEAYTRSGGRIRAYPGGQPPMESDKPVKQRRHKNPAMANAMRDALSGG